MRLRRFVGLQEQLLPTSAGSQGMELVESTSSSSSRGSGIPPVHVIKHRFRDYMISVLLLVAISVPSITVAGVVATQWQSNSSQRGWLILGFGFYIVAGLRWLGSMLLQLSAQLLYLRVEVRRFASSTLFDAITDAVASEAEKLGQTSSFDQEAVQHHDEVTGKIAVKFKFWSSQPRKVEIAIAGPLNVDGQTSPEMKVQICFEPGDYFSVGRESRSERRDTLVLWVRTSSSTVLSDKRILSQWLEESYSKHMKPTPEVVNIYALQESSSDWVPEWKFERVKPCKSTESAGQAFFLERKSLGSILADAKLWSSSTLRVYMVTGPPGVGKSEFTIWMAGQLGLPVYRLSLTNRQLTDERLAQLLSQSSVSFNSVLVQIDEFQETVKRWMSGGNVGVTPGGFCEVLQGSTSMSHGVVVLTGTGSISAESVKIALPAVFRRIHVTGELKWMSLEDIEAFFRQFLARFVPSCSTDEFSGALKTFLECDCWSGSRPISIDMLKQFLMRQITQSSCEDHGVFVNAEDGTHASVFQVIPEKRTCFFGLICDAQAANKFLDSYAPVNQASSVLSEEKTS